MHRAHRPGASPRQLCSQPSSHPAIQARAGSQPDDVLCIKYAYSCTYQVPYLATCRSRDLARYVPRCTCLNSTGTINKYMYILVHVRNTESEPFASQLASSQPSSQPASPDASCNVLVGTAMHWGTNPRLSGVSAACPGTPAQVRAWRCGGVFCMRKKLWLL